MLFSCHLEAQLPEANLSRAYRVMVLRDLFGLYTVDVTFGRIGRPCSTRRYTVANLDAARSKLKEILKRRLTAPQRIGVAYVCRAAFDPQDWMAQDNVGFTSLVTTT